MDPLVLRFIERITAVLIGGMAVYLGYRLFRAVPEQQDGSGKVVLPWDVSIVVSRVGPGVFFALFGVIAVGIALVRPLQIDSTPDGREIHYAAAMQDAGAERRADARALLRRDIALLNSLPAQVPASERASVERGVARIKLALLQSVWGTPGEGFGDPDAFGRWVDAGANGDPPADMEAAVALWRYGQPEP